MGLLDLFRRSPKPCTTCLGPSAELHRVLVGRPPEETERLCTPCMTARLEKEIAGKRIVFVEPRDDNAYTYSALAEQTDELACERAALAFRSFGARCAECAAPPQHLWLSLDDLDWDEMNARTARNFAMVFAEPSRWSGARPLCARHAVPHLRRYVEEKRYGFLNFRFPDASESGWYE